MPEKPTIDPELTRLAASLAGLTPATPALDRDRLFYEAGCRARAVAPRTWTWPLATTVAASLAFGLGLRLAPPPEAVLVPQVVEVPVPAPVSPPSPALVPETYAVAPGLHPGAEALRRREQRMLWDSEMLPSLTVSVPTESVESLLGIRRGSLSDVQLQRFKAALAQGDI